MSPTPRSPLTSLRSDRIRASADATGDALAAGLGALLSALPGAPLGPKRLAERFEIHISTASRLIRGIAQPSALDVLRDIPGPAPLRSFLATVPRDAVPTATLETARDAVERLEELIQALGGSRGALAAALANWQPQAERKLVLKSRQSAYRATAELKGASSQCVSNTYVVHPSSQDPDLLELVRISAEVGIVRTRKDASVLVSSMRRSLDGAPLPPPLHPLTLEGESALDRIHSVMLEEFCVGRPAPLTSTTVGDRVLHRLGPTEYVHGKGVDLLLAERFSPGLRRRALGRCEDPMSFFMVPGVPSQALNLTVLIHEDVLPPWGAELLVYDTIPMGPATPLDPAREHDLVTIPETLEVGSSGAPELLVPEFPRSLEVLEHVLGRLSWDPRRFASWRLRVSHPPLGNQFVINFGRPAAPA